MLNRLRAKNLELEQKYQNQKDENFPNQYFCPHN